MVQYALHLISSAAAILSHPFVRSAFLFWAGWIVAEKVISVLASAWLGLRSPHASPGGGPVRPVPHHLQALYLADDTLAPRWWRIRSTASMPRPFPDDHFDEPPDPERDWDAFRAWLFAED